MPSIISKQVYLSPRQERELRRMARESGETESSIIGEALDCLILRQKLREKAWNAERAFIEEWMAKSPVPGDRPRWRREDLYDRKGPC
jgi:hypothetical protein